MDKLALESYLHHNIPISKAMGVGVASAEQQKVILSASYANNINHKKTVFGGSLHAVATLSCWCLLYLKVRDMTEPSEIVVAKSSMDYLLPVTSDFVAICNEPEQDVWHEFEKMLLKKGKARVQLESQISHQGHIAAQFQGSFVALKRKRTERT